VLPSILAAALLAAGGGATAAQVVSARLGRPLLRLGPLLHTLEWGDPAPTAAGGGLALTGLLLVLAAVLPGRTRTAPLAGDDPRFVTGLGRSSLRAALRATVLAVPGVHTATVRLRGRLRPRAEIRAVAAFHEPGELGERVADAVRDRLADLDPVRVPAVVVRVAGRKE
jgi:Family of unknown function (DUF6286)